MTYSDRWAAAYVPKPSRFRRVIRAAAYGLVVVVVPVAVTTFLTWNSVRTP